MLADGFTQLQKTEMDTNTVPHQQGAEVNLRRATTANVTTGFWGMISEEAAKDVTQKSSKRRAKCRIAIKLPEVAHFPYMMLQ